MKILKFKKTTKGKYKLFLDNNISISLYEDIIINNNLLITKEIRDDELDKILKENNDVNTYHIALNYISIKMRSIKEIKEYLIRKKISNDSIQKTVDILIKKGYLNDFKYAKAYVNDQMLLSNKGPLKIKQELIKHDINSDVINEVIEEIDENILKEKLSNLIAKQVKIKKGSSKIVKIKLVNYFINLGYDKNMILDELSNYNIKSDYEKLKKDYEKIYKKYKDKCSSSELLFLISNKLYAKGYTAEDINEVLDDN